MQAQPTAADPIERCAVCHNTYDKMIHVESGGQTLPFDCFECAIHRLAPECEHCGVRVVGHGVEADGHVYCCAHCARHEGEDGLRDRA
jgi:hypothetical protein